MKRFFSILLLIGLVLLTGGCKTRKEAPNDDYYDDLFIAYHKYYLLTSLGDVDKEEWIHFIDEDTYDSSGFLSHGKYEIKDNTIYFHGKSKDDFYVYYSEAKMINNTVVFEQVDDDGNLRTLTFTSGEELTLPAKDIPTLYLAVGDPFEHNNSSSSVTVINNYFEFEELTKDQVYLMLDYDGATDDFLLRKKPYFPENKIGLTFNHQNVHPHEYIFELADRNTEKIDDWFNENKLLYFSISTNYSSYQLKAFFIYDDNGHKNLHVADISPSIDGDMEMKNINFYIPVSSEDYKNLSVFLDGKKCEITELPIYAGSYYRYDNETETIDESMWLTLNNDFTYLTSVPWTTTSYPEGEYNLDGNILTFSGNSDWIIRPTIYYSPDKITFTYSSNLTTFSIEFIKKELENSEVKLGKYHFLKNDNYGLIEDAYLKLSSNNRYSFHLETANIISIPSLNKYGIEGDFIIHGKSISLFPDYTGIIPSLNNREIHQIPTLFIEENKLVLKDIFNNEVLYTLIHESNINDY